MKSIHIQNYRSHKDTLIDFSDGVNSITGSNDSGKTNILRAITTVVKNRPSGNDFISHWGGNMAVRIDFNEKAIVRYKDVIKDKKSGNFKAGSKNFYILINKSNFNKSKIDKDYKKAIKDGKSTGCVDIFKSFGQGVPDEIKKVLNMSDINIAPQFEGPFLLTKSAPDTAKFYNDIVNLDIIDKSISNISKELKKEKKNLSIEKEKNEEKNKELKSFDWIDKAEKDIKKAEVLKNKIKLIKDNWTKLYQWNKELINLNAKNYSINEITKHSDAVDELIKLSAEIKKDDELFVELESLDNNRKYLIKKKENLNKIINHDTGVNKLIELNDKIKSIKANLAPLKFFKNKLVKLKDKEKEIKIIVKFESRINKLIELEKDIKKGNSKYNSLFDLCESLDKFKKKINDLKKKQIDLEEELNKLMPSICPLCENKIN